MDIRFYVNQDYSNLITLYTSSTEFKVDPITDSQESLFRKITKDSESILIAEKDDKMIGSVSIIEDGRIAILFRLVVEPNLTDSFEVIQSLIAKAELVLKQRFYKEVHILAPALDPEAHKKRLAQGFQQGSDYTWFWKKIG